MRNARLGLLFALAGCQAAGLAPSAAVPPQASGVRREATPDTRSGHVFVAVTSATHYPSVERDRKSTRLNSSHVEISYAVFCLKKKKKSCRPRAKSTDSSDDAANCGERKR